MSELKEWALNYVDNGYCIMPLRPGSKAAAKKGSDLGGLHNPCRSSDDVERLWSEADYGIGLPLGKINNLVGLDVDYDDGCRKDFLSFMPPTYVTKTGSGNHHVLFRYTPLVKNGTVMERGVTIKSDGSYFVMPPTIHDKTWVAYTAERPLWKGDIDDMPVTTQAVPAPVLALAPKIQEGIRRPELFRVCGAMRRVGMNDVEIFPALKELNRRCSPPLPESELWRLAKGVMRYAPAETPSDPLMDMENAQEALCVNEESGAALHTPDNVLRLLEYWAKTKDSIWFDEFHKKYFTTWKGPKTEWTDTDTRELMFLLQRQTGLIRITLEQVDLAVSELARKNTRNEPLDWFKSLEWDKKKRIESFFATHCGVEESDYSLAASRNWWVSMVARVFVPGCKVDNMVIWEGSQGKLKSTALSVIGNGWYCESYGAISEKDFSLTIQGKLLVEISELDAFSRAETSAVKKAISMQVDRFRLPYGRKAQDFPRSCVFVGTTNEENYLKDATGNRRFWPMRVGEIDIPLIRKDREQLFAEAVAAYRAGTMWHEMPASAVDEQGARMEEDDPWTELVAEFLARTSQVTVNTLLGHLRVDEQHRAGWHGKRIGKILRSLGWENHRERDGKGVRNSVWRPKVATLAGQPP